MRLRSTIRWLGRGLAALVVLAAAGIVGGLAWLSTSLPVTEGRHEIAKSVGFDVLASIERDVRGVPYIHARTPGSASFALGFVHAQDRLFQMDVQRRAGAGTLSELFGARALDFDRYLRTLGFRRLATADLRALNAGTRGRLEAYAAGVNAYLARHEGAWPPEYEVLRVEPAPWTPVDSLLVLKGLHVLLGINMHDELTRLRLAARLDLDRVADFWPPLPGETLPPLPSPPVAFGGATGGSNSWVLDGRRTESGKPLLANDPHLGLGLPGLWYLARVTYQASLDSPPPWPVLVGATVPGLPIVVLGHNGHVAWGFTNAYVDAQDLFIERLDPADPDRYLTPQGSLAFVLRDEVLHVKGAPDQILRVRETRHGPVVSGVHWDAAAAVPPGHVLALRWTALEPGDATIGAAERMGAADTVTQFFEAARDFRGPMQNIVVADTLGHIGLTIPGLVPIRPPRIDGGMPAPGWTGTHDWFGYAEIGALPGGLDPPSGSIVTANTRVVPKDFPLFLARDWPPTFRAERIAALLDARERHGIDDLLAMQRDVGSLAAVSLMPALRASRPATELGQRANSLLAAWDGEMAADRSEPLIFAAWFVEVWRRLVADELGPVFEELSAPDPILLEAILAGERAAWCDDVTTKATEDCETVAAAALDDATAGLVERFGADIDGWRWGDAHRARHAHPIFGRIPLIGELFTIDQPIGGDRYTINVSSLGWDEDPFASSFGAGFRAVYDLGDLDNSRFVIAVGQSGNPFSDHYDDLAEAWLANDAFTLPPEPAGPVERLDLVPEGWGPE